MSMRKSSRKTGKENGARLFLPLHQEYFTEALATGLVKIGSSRVITGATVDAPSLEKLAKEFGYGEVGLLELTSGLKIARDHVLLVDCSAYWLRNQSTAEELLAKAGLFGDTVPGALAVRVDPTLFGAHVSDVDQVGPAPELPLAVGSNGVAADIGALDESSIVLAIAGGACMVRHRSLSNGVGLHVLGELLAPNEPPADPPVARAAAFAMQIMRGVFRHVAIGAQFAPGELEIVAAAAKLVSDMDPGLGIEPTQFCRDLLDETDAESLPDAAELAAKFAVTVEKLSRNELDLTAARIDDSGQVGLRGLMLFLIAPEPTQHLKWMAARKDVGSGVSIISAMFSGLFAGIGGVPREQKAPTTNSFLACTTFARDYVRGAAVGSVSTRWLPEGGKEEVLELGKLEFAGVSTPPLDAVASLLDSCRAMGLAAEVERATGAISLPLPGNAEGRAMVSIGDSHWHPQSTVVKLTLGLKHGGRGLPSRDLLIQLLADEMAPVWAVCGPTSADILLHREVPIPCRAQSANWKEVLTSLVDKAAVLGLAMPTSSASRKRAASKATPRKK